MANIDFSAAAGKWNGDNGAGRAILYDANGNPIVRADRSQVTPGSVVAQAIQGVDYKQVRMARVSADAAWQSDMPQLLLYDSCEGAAVDTNKWVQSTLTMTIVQAAQTGICFNNNNTATTATGAMQVSNRFYPRFHKSGLRRRIRARHTTHFDGNVIEHGFGNPSTATTVSIGDGAIWRKTGAGEYIPVIVINGSEIPGAVVSQATFTAAIPQTEYFEMEIQLWGSRAFFAIYTNAGVLVSGQDVDLTGNMFSATHLRALDRTYNASATGTATQMFMNSTAVDLIDRNSSRSWGEQMAGLNYGGITSPTAYTQLANYSNSAAPTTRTLSNTAAAETTLGGLLRVNSIAGGNTDYIMFGFTVVSPYTFWVTSVRIPPPINEVVAIATTDTIFTYFLAFGSSAVSLATGSTYPPMRKPLAGTHRGIVADAAGVQFRGETIVWQPPTPIPVYGGRFFHVGCRELVGTATATETYLWASVDIDGYWE